MGRQTREVSLAWGLGFGGHTLSHVTLWKIGSLAKPRGTAAITASGCWAVRAMGDWSHLPVRKPGAWGHSSGCEEVLIVFPEVTPQPSLDHIICPYSLSGGGRWTFQATFPTRRSEGVSFHQEKEGSRQEELKAQRGEAVCPRSHRTQ